MPHKPTFPPSKKRSIEVRETAEEAVVSKSARVVAAVEVEVGKTATAHEEIVHRTVRKTKGDVERVDRGCVPFIAASPTCMLPRAQRSRRVPLTPVWSKKLDPKHGTQQPHRKQRSDFFFCAHHAKPSTAAAIHQLR